jgi:hypothetical protein
MRSWFTSLSFGPDAADGSRVDTYDYFDPAQSLEYLKNACEIISAA